MNPLEKIENWLNNLPADIKSELIAIAGYFHPAEDVYNELSTNKTEPFMKYLDSSSLDEREIVLRVFIVTKLIDYSFCGRDSKEGWTEALDNNLMAASRMKEKGHSTDIVDKFLSTFHERKDSWIELSKNWHEFKANQISDRQVADWHFTEAYKDLTNYMNSRTN